MHSTEVDIIYKASAGIRNFLIVALASLTLTACGGGGGSEDFNISNPTPGDVGDGSDDGSNPDVVNGFNVRTAQLTLEGPVRVAAGSTTDYTATLLNRNGIAPASPPGVNIELTLTGDGFTNPPDGGDTDRDGEFNFTFTAPDEGGQTTIRTLVRNDEDEIVRRDGIVVTVVESLFDFVSPPEDTQLIINQSREIQFNWRIGNEGATTGNRSQGSPSAIRFTLAGRPAGGGFLLGNATTPQDSVVVNIVNGQLDQDVSVLAGDSGGPVNVVASASTNSQSLQAELPLIFVGEPTRIDASPSNIGVAQQGAELLEVQVFDENGTPLSGIPLRFRISICIDGQTNTIICNGTGEQITRELRTTDSEGEATTGFIGGNSNGGGEIEITVNGGPAAGLERAIVYNVGGTSSGGGTGGTDGGTDGGSTGGTQQVFNFPENNAQVAIGTPQEIVFNVRDSDGIAVAGESVTFTIDRGLIDDNANTAPPPSNTRTFTTGGQGDIRFQVISNEVGPATLSGGSIQLDLQFVQSLTDIAVQPASASIAPGGTNTITATALDANGDPIEGIVLQFIIDANSSNGGNGGSLTPSDGVSDEQGQVTTTFTAGPGTGTVVIRAANQTESTQESTDFQVAP